MFARSAYKIFKKVLTNTRNACIIKTVKDTTHTYEIHGGNNYEKRL